MKPVLVVAGLLAALAGLAGLAYLGLGSAPQPKTTSQPPAPEPGPGSVEEVPAEKGLRPYRTLATLCEDLRDALADEGAQLDAETWRVSGLLGSDARRVLTSVAPEERSPKVRGLLVLAAGVHLPDDPTLHGFLNDRFAVVREAAVLAMGTGTGPGDANSPLYLNRVRVAVGQSSSARARARLNEHRAGERDEAVLAALEAVLAD